MIIFLEFQYALLSGRIKKYSACWELRGYVESQEIIIASDHQPLKWLMSIKSPSGRLAKWSSINPLIRKLSTRLVKPMSLQTCCLGPTNLNEDVPCDICSIS
ncbi:hypothetical protein AVEN_63553-1 [Araneus ventricosus]|uniref:Reverse transcriptase RNase H-like domain-containing protein n=1 Tax=Araneus ventricosus TaxID=182803 RepID=A0A4Y2SGN5_ARAVE|nr:hypothetical protein AVEN_63553-1 [Araneus ventricosus]